MCSFTGLVENRLKAMTAVQMDFLGLKEFKIDEKSQEVHMVLHMDNVGDIPMEIRLKNHQLDSAKVIFLRGVSDNRLYTRVH
jgi:hypothetical protein